MSDGVLIAIITGTASLIAAIIAAKVSIKQTKLQRQVAQENANIERRAEERKQESLLAMKLTHANTQLTVGCAMAIKTGHANGEIEHGLSLVQDASREYDNYLIKMANEHLH